VAEPTGSATNVVILMDSWFRDTSAVAGSLKDPGDAKKNRQLGWHRAITGGTSAFTGDPTAAI
jgi:hypothetical protein